MNANHVIINSTYICLTNIDDQLNVDELLDHHEETIHRTLNVQSTNMTIKTYDDISTIVEKFGISDLRISYCAINDMNRFMSMIMNKSTLRHLTIGNCHDVDDNASTYVASALHNNIQLTSLILSYNAMTLDGFNNIMQSLTTNTILREFSTSDNNLFSQWPIDAIIATVPLMKSLRLLSVPVTFRDYRHNDLYNAFKCNYSIVDFNTFNLNNGRYLNDQIEKICERNCHIRFYAYSRLPEIAVALAPLIRTHVWFDAYCLMWIYDYMHEYNCSANEFKKIKIINSVFDIYRKKIYNETLTLDMPLCSTR